MTDFPTLAADIPAEPTVGSVVLGASGRVAQNAGTACSPTGQNLWGRTYLPENAPFERPMTWPELLFQDGPVQVLYLCPPKESA